MLNISFKGHGLQVRRNDGKLYGDADVTNTLDSILYASARALVRSGVALDIPLPQLTVEEIADRTDAELRESIKSPAMSDDFKSQFTLTNTATGLRVNPLTGADIPEE